MLYPQDTSPAASVSHGTTTPVMLTSSYSGSPSVLSGGPSALPPSVTNMSGLSISKPAELGQRPLPSSLVPPAGFPPPSIPSELSSGQQVQPSHHLSMTGTTAATGSAVPPPPTMGFIPSHGVVASHPTKVPS